MNWKKVLNWIFAVLLLVLLLFNGYSFYQIRHQSEPEVIYLHDTVTIHTDSIITKTKWKTHFDTVYIKQYVDSITKDTVTDSIPIEIPIEHKVSEFKIKKDSLLINETIWHSGFHTTIDSIKLDYNWNYEITKPKPKKIGWVWTAGFYAGYGIGFNNGQYYFSPEVGVGVSIGIGGIIK